MSPFDRDLGCATPGTMGRATHLGDPLTCEQIRELPDRAEIVITWDGGNGPWPVRVLVDFEGRRRVEGAYCDLILGHDFDGEQQIPFHRVTLGWDDAARAWDAQLIPLPQHLIDNIAYWRTGGVEPST